MEGVAAAEVEEVALPLAEELIGTELDAGVVEEAVAGVDSVAELNVVLEVDAALGIDCWLLEMETTGEEFDDRLMLTAGLDLEEEDDDDAAFEDEAALPVLLYRLIRFPAPQYSLLFPAHL